MSTHFFKNMDPKTKRGFTIIETLVAIAIILIAIVGPFESVENAVVASYISRDELIADSLAQEGVEYVQMVRDNNYLWNRKYGAGTVTYMGGFDTTTNGSQFPFTADCFSTTCTIDPLPSGGVSPVVACPTNNPCPILYIAHDDTYTQTASAIPSRFTRSIQLCYMKYTGGVYRYCSSQQADLSNEVRLTVTVSWTTEGRPFTTTITEYLQNWI